MAGDAVRLLILFAAIAAGLVIGKQAAGKVTARF